MKNFYDLLTWRDAAKNSFPERLFFYPPDEFSGDLKIYISFEEREAHLTQRSVHVGFADNAVPTQILENFLKLVAELWKHAVVSAAPFNEWRSPDCPRQFGNCRSLASRIYFFGVCAAGGTARAGLSSI